MKDKYGVALELVNNDPSVQGSVKKILYVIYDSETGDTLYTVEAPLHDFYLHPELVTQKLMKTAINELAEVTTT